jgi:magnesium transporter
MRTTADILRDPQQTTQRLHTRRNQAGASPGTMFVAPDAEPTALYYLQYGPAGHVEQKLENLNELDELAVVPQPWIGWLDVRGLGTQEVLEQVGKRFDIHALALADVVNAPQRPKTEHYDNHLLIISQMAQLETLQDEAQDRHRLGMEQVTIVLGRGWVVTFQESDENGDVLEPVRQRIRQSRGKIRHSGADYLAYALLDAVVDGYYPVLEELGQGLEELEMRVLSRPSQVSGQQIHNLKRTLLLLRRGIWPMRDALSNLMRGDELEDGTSPMNEATLVYLRDVYDHSVQIVDMIETYREFAASLMDVYLSSVNNRMNEVVKVLTIISTIFLPLSFIAGIYGMNFDTSASPWNMPELKWPYGYEFSLFLMLATAASMLLVFRHFGWIGRPSKWPREEREGREGSTR